LKKRIKALGSFLITPDTLAFAGLGLVISGVAHWSGAAASILAGLMLFTYAYVTANPRKK